VKAFDSQSLAEVRSFYAYDPTFTGGVSVTSKDLEGDGQDELVTGAGPGSKPHVKVFNFSDLQEVRSFFAFTPTDFRGVFVG